MKKLTKLWRGLYWKVVLQECSIRAVQKAMPPIMRYPIVIFIDLCGEEIYVNEGMKSYQDKLVAEAKRIWDALTKSMTPQTEQEKKADWWKWARSEIKSRWTERDKKLNELDKLFDNYKTT